MPEILENFLNLNPKGMADILSEVNPDFSNLDDSGKSEIIADIQSGKLNVVKMFEAGEIKKDSPEFTTAQKIFNIFGPSLRSVSEPLALMTGGIIGAPGGPVTSVLAAGAAFTGVQSFFNGIEESLGLRKQPSVTGKAVEVLKSFKEGTEAEATGQILGPALGAAKRFVGKQLKRVPTPNLALTQKGAQTKALERFEQEAIGTPTTQPQINENVRLARELEDVIPGLKFDQGQLTGDASAIALTKSLASREGRDLSQSQRELANQVLDDFFSKKVAGTGEVSALSDVPEQLEKALIVASKEAEEAVTSEVSRISRDLNVQDIGRNISGKISKELQALKGKVSAQFDKIPDLKVKTQPLSDSIKQVKSELLKGEDVEDIPTKAIKLIKTHIFKKTKAVKQAGFRPTQLSAPESNALQDIDIKTARGINRSIRNMIKKASSGTESNELLVRRLQILKNGINESFSLTAESGGQKGIDILKKANALRVEQAERFGQGTAAKALQAGIRGEDTRIAKSVIGQTFNSLEGIDDLIVALGNKKEASSAMKDFFSFDLLNKAMDKTTGKLVGRKLDAWVSANSSKLKKLNLLSEFKNTQELQGKVDGLILKRDIFNKSVAGRILEADTDTIITNAFRGSKNFAKTADDLMGLVKDNLPAEQGLKKAISQHIVRESETTALEFFQKAGETVADAEFIKSVNKMTTQIKKFRPALTRIFKNEPERLKALDHVWKAYQTISRTAKSPVGGGSDSFELFGRSMDIVAGSTAPGQWYAFKTVRDMVSRFGKDNVDIYLRKAMFDPDYAQTLRAVTRGLGNEPSKLKMINSLMSVIALETKKSFQVTNQEVTTFGDFPGISSAIEPSAPFQQPIEQTISQGR